MEYSELDVWSAEAANEIIKKRGVNNGTLLEVLVEFQERFGQITEDAVAILADRFNLSQAEVFGVVTFYKDLRSHRSGLSTVRVCRGESCQAMGASELVDAAEKIFATKLDTTSGNGEVTLEQVFCLGNCAMSPSISVNGELIGRVDVAKLNETAKQIEERVK